MKYSQFNSILPYNGSLALYNSFQQKVLFLENELNDLLQAARAEGIDILGNYHPDFYNYLKDNRFIVEDNVNELEEVKKKSKSVDETQEEFVLTINPTMNCNFKCWYCYETHIKDSRLEVTVMDSINLLVNKICSKPELKTLTLAFFGGEPLLYFKKNVIPIVDHVVEVCEKYDKEFTISFTTNGYLTDDYFIEYFRKKNLNIHLQITFDGYKEEHDEVRFVSKTKGSYDEIIKNIRKLLSYDNFTIKARINYTDKNIHNCHKIVDDFADLIEKIDKNKLMFDYHRVWQNDQLDDTSKFLDENSKKMQEKGFMTHVHYSPNNVNDSCYADKRNSVVVNYNGDIYKCTARDFVPRDRAGYLSEDGELIWNDGYIEKRMDSKFNNKPCLSCRIMPLCNGGCSQHAMENLGGDGYCVYHGDEQQKSNVILAKIDEIVNAPQEV